MNDALCSVQGCGKPATAFLQLKVPLDDGQVVAISLPQLFCEDDRAQVRARVGEMKDEVWAEVEKLLPEGRKGLRSKVDVGVADIISPLPPPPEIAQALDKLVFAQRAFFGIPGAGPVRGHAAMELGTRAAACAKVLRNYPAARAECAAAAEAFDAFAETIRKIGKHLSRNEPQAAEDLVQKMGQQLQRCRVLTAIASTAIAAPNPEAA